MSIKRILAPTDFSEVSNKAIDVAVAIATKGDAEIVLMHTSLPTEGINSNVYAAIYIHEYLEIKRKNLQQMAERLKEKGFDGKISTDNKVDFTVPSIVNAAAEFEADLVIMGSTGTSGLSGVILGSTAGGVLSKIDHPLFLIPKDYVLPESGHLLIGTDYKTAVDPGSLNIIEFFKEKLNFRIQLIHIEKEGEENVDREKYVRDNFKSLIDGSISLPGGKVEEALLKLKEKYTNAVLCTVTKKRNWFENIFYHSVSKSLAHYSDVALLCLHEE